MLALIQRIRKIVLLMNLPTVRQWTLTISPIVNANVFFKRRNCLHKVIWSLAFRSGGGCAIYLPKYKEEIFFLLISYHKKNVAPLILAVIKMERHSFSEPGFISSLNHIFILANIK